MPGLLDDTLWVLIVGGLLDLCGWDPPAVWVRVPSAALEVDADFTENHTYGVIVRSVLRLRLILNEAANHAGDPVVPSTLTAAWVPITGASVVRSTTASGQLLANWFAIVGIHRIERHRAYCSRFCWCVQFRRRLWPETRG